MKGQADNSAERSRRAWKAHEDEPGLIELHGLVAHSGLARDAARCSSAAGAATAIYKQRGAADEGCHRFACVFVAVQGTVRDLQGYGLSHCLTKWLWTALDESRSFPRFLWIRCCECWAKGRGEQPTAREPPA